MLDGIISESNPMIPASRFILTAGIAKFLRSYSGEALGFHCIFIFVCVI